MRSTCALASCGQTFEAKRSDARYCSASCRAKASRERRSSEGTRQAPPQETASKAALHGSHEKDHLDRSRLDRLEERIMDLEGDVEAAEHERDGLMALRTRLEAAVARAQAAAEEAQEAAEAAAKAAVEPIRDELAAASSPADMSELWELIEGMQERLAALEERGEVGSAPVGRLDEIERAVIKLARRSGRLRSELDQLVRAIDLLVS